MDNQFKGNEPQPGVHVPPEMLTSRIQHDAHTPAARIEPPIGNVIQFESGATGKAYAAIRTGDGWYVAGIRGPHTWEAILLLTNGTVFVMAPRVALHP